MRMLEFQTGDKLFLKVSPIKGVRRFKARGKLSTTYIKLYEITKMLNLMAYQLNLPGKHEYIHNVFHISQLQKYVPNPSHIIEAKPIELVKNLACKERYIQIRDCTVKLLHNKGILLVKVRRANYTSSEGTWETEEDMKNKYLYLFEVSFISFRDETYFRGEGYNVTSNPSF